MTDKIRNGELWKQPKFPHFERIIQWIDKDYWMLMSTPQKGSHGWLVSIPTSGTDGKLVFTAAELLERLEKNGYEPVGIE